MYEWAKSQNFTADGFKLVEITKQFNKNFIKIYNEDNYTGYIFKVDIQYPIKLQVPHTGLSFFAWKNEN